MKKIKDMWNRNRVLIILVIIVLVCFCIMGVVMVKYFFGVNTSSYGDRLDDIQELPFKEEDQTSLINLIKENDIVSDVTINVKGKIIYIRILFNEKATLDSAKGVANKSLEGINEEYQSKYDLEYTIVQEANENVGGFTLMGAKNINRGVLIWNNNTPIKDEEQFL